MHDIKGQDTTLLHLLSQGDETAFRRLFDTYHQFIYSFALRMTDSEAISRDVVQDVFVKIWLNRQELTAIQHLPGYINRLTRNHVLNGMKRKALETGLLKDLGTPFSAAGNDPEEQAQFRELEALLARAINLLPERQQQVYKLSRQDGLKHEEIAAQLQISRETVKKHIMAALLHIRNYLRDNGRTLLWLGVLLYECRC